jgi:ABC-type multidrug transport system ATPase subunit
MGEAALAATVAAVRVSGLQKSYKKQPAVRTVDMTVRQGEMFGLIGPDGAGKSTLLKAIAGVLRFDAGTVEVFGLSLDSEAAAERVKHRIGFMPQGLGLNLYPDLSVDENVDFFAELRLVPREVLQSRKAQLLAMTRLDAFRDREMKHLSGGMKQKLGLVCTLIHQPALVILDEPTTGVDPVSRREFWRILAELVRERGVTALVSTAYMDEASRFDRLALMFRGSLLATGTPADVQALIPAAEVAIRAEPQVEALRLLKKAYAQVEMVGPWLEVFVEGADAPASEGPIRELLAGVRVDDLQVNEPELEDIFVALIRRQTDEGIASAAVAPSWPSEAQPMNESTAVWARTLVKDFGAFRAVDDVSFEIRSGEIFGLLGPNGAGKTTVIKMLTGILSPNAGEGRVAGADMRSGGMLIKERIGYVSQAFSLYSDLTVSENISLFAGIYGLSRQESKPRVAWIIDLAGLHGYESVLAARLPMGLRQRLALGCALVHRPRVLFLDEPTSGVDPLGRRLFWTILLHLARHDGVAILVTTHYMSEAEHCDRLALMHGGRMVSTGTPQEMKEAAIGEAGMLLEIIADQPARGAALLEQAGFPGVGLYGARIHLLAGGTEDPRPRVRTMLADAGVRVSSLSIRPPTLEDVFVYRVQQREQRGRERPA